MARVTGHDGHMARLYVYGRAPRDNDNLPDTKTEAGRRSGLKRRGPQAEEAHAHQPPASSQQENLARGRPRRGNERGRGIGSHEGCGSWRRQHGERRD